MTISIGKNDERLIPIEQVLIRTQTGVCVPLSRVDRWAYCAPYCDDFEIEYFDEDGNVRSAGLGNRPTALIVPAKESS